jgi:hypothetical protein
MTRNPDGGNPVDEDIRTDLRAASDRIMAMVESLRVIETTKRRHHPGSPEFLWYAERVEELSQAILDMSRRERDAAQRADAEPGASPVTVEETPPPSIPELLERWREAERGLAAAAAGSDEAAALREESEHARQLYRRAIDSLTVQDDEPTP